MKYKNHMKMTPPVCSRLCIQIERSELQVASLGAKYSNLMFLNITKKKKKC